MSASPARRSRPDPDRHISGLARVGVVETVDLEAATAIVRFGETLSAPLQWLGRAGLLTLFAPPSVGEQVLVLAPESDPEQAIILGGLFSTAQPPAETTLKLVLAWLEGARGSYDPETHEMRLTVPGKIIVEAQDGLEIIAETRITGDTSIIGAVSIEGAVTVSDTIDAAKTITSEEDVVGGGKSLKTHRHTGVTTGGGLSGAPQ